MKSPPATSVVGGLGLAHCCLAEQKPESWPGGTKLRRLRHGEIELQSVREQEYPVDGRAALEIGQVDCVEFIAEHARPVSEYVSDWHMVGDGEGEVQVGAVVATAVHGERADGGSGHDALILLREL